MAFFALEYYKRRLFLLLLMMIVLGYGVYPAWRESKGPIFQGIRSADNKYVQHNKFAESIPGMKGGNVVLIELAFGRPVTAEDLLYIRAYSENLEAKTGWVVISPSTCPKMDGFSVGSYIPFYGVEDAEAWQLDIAKDPLCGQFLSEDFFSAYVLLIVPTEVHELEAHRILSDALENVELNNWFQRVRHELAWLLWKYDLFPVERKSGPKIYVYSWLVGRGSISQGSNRDINLKFPIGLVLFTGAFLLVSLHFLPQYYVPVMASIFFSLVFTLGSIWLLHPLGVYRTVYTSVPLAGAALVMGLSFAVQKMDSFRSALGTDLLERWRNAGRNIHPSIHIITVFTLAAFLLFTVNFGGVWRMVELGVLFVLGAFFAWLNAVFFLPALHLFWVGRCGERTEEDLWQWQRNLCDVMDRFLLFLVRSCIHWNVVLCQKVLVRRFVHVNPAIWFTTAVYLYYGGHIETVSRSLSFLAPDSNVRRMADRASRPGGPGFDPFQIHFGMPDTADAIKTDEFLALSLAFQNRLKAGPDMRMVLSMTQAVAYQLETNPELSEPRIESAIGLVEDGEDMIHPTLKEYLHNDRFIQILAFHPMRTNVEVREGLNYIESVADEFMRQDERLLMYVHGPVPIYAEMAEQIPDQVPQNVILSLVFVFTAYALVIAFLNRKHKKRVISPWWGGWVLGQPFMLSTGMTGCFMAALAIPLNVATAPISEIAIAAAADFNVYPSLAFLGFLYLGYSALTALKGALAEKAEAVAKDFIGNWLCFLLLAWSVFSPVADLGRLMLFNLFVCAAWGLFATLPALVASAVNTKEVNHERPVLRLVISGSHSVGAS